MSVQIVSFFTHLGWLAFFPFFRQTNIIEFVYALPLVALWILTNMAVALIAALIMMSDPRDNAIR